MKGDDGALAAVCGDFAVEKKLWCQGAVAVGENMFYNIVFKNFLLKNLVVSAEVPTFALAFGKEPRQAEGQRS